MEDEVINLDEWKGLNNKHWKERMFNWPDGTKIKFLGLEGVYLTEGPNQYQSLPMMIFMENNQLMKGVIGVGILKSYPVGLEHPKSEYYLKMIRENQNEN